MFGKRAMKAIHEYVTSLLLERKEQLQALEHAHEQESTLGGDYFTCRRSLVDGIAQLEALLLQLDSGTRAETHCVRRVEESQEKMGVGPAKQC